jgi:hypothetical protein
MEEESLMRNWGCSGTYDAGCLLQRNIVNLEINPVRQIAAPMALDA